MLQQQLRKSVGIPAARGFGLNQGFSSLALLCRCQTGLSLFIIITPPCRGRFAWNDSSELLHEVVV
jgi:hypothetical protein